MINPKIYNGGCLDLQIVLRYLEEKNELQEHSYQSERERVDNHLHTCKNCNDRIVRFANTYNSGDDPSNMIF